MIGELLLTLILTQDRTIRVCPLFTTDPAQNGRPAGYLISGKVLLPSNRTFDGIQVVVQLQAPNGVTIQSTSTDTQGNFTFPCVDNAYTIVIKAEGYDQVGGTLRLREKDAITPDSALANDVVDFGDLARKYPKKAIQDYDKALDEIKKGNLDKAAKLLLTLLKAAPEFYAAHNTLGTVYQKLNWFADSEAQYQRARQLSPRAVEPLINLGSLYIAEADAQGIPHEDAIALLNKARGLLEESLQVKSNSLSYYLLGLAYYKSDFYDEAEKNLKHALEMNPYPPSVRLILANLYIRLQKWPDALVHLDAYLSENARATDRTEIQKTRAKVLQRLK